MAKRNEIETKYKWVLDDIILESKWEETFESVKKQLPKLAEFRNKIGTVEGFSEFSKIDEKIGLVVEDLYVFSMMKRDEDGANSKYTALCDRAEGLYTEYMMATSYVGPQLTALPEAQLKELASSPKLKDYDYFFKQIIDQKAHILSENEEALLAGAGEITGGFHDVFSMIDNVDLNLGSIMVNGKEEQLTHGKYSLFMQDKDREVRKNAFETYYEAYKKLIHTIAATYNFNVKKDWFFAKAKKYGSRMEYALAGEDVDPKVYNNLLESVNENVSVLHDYINLKKKMLGLSDFAMYDMYVPIVDGAELKLGYEQAYDLVKGGLKVLGDDYVALLERAYNESWIDVYENEGKRSGAYSISTKVAHPYVLLNYKETTHDIFTIAHEMGHSLHSYFSNEAQPMPKKSYVIFVAEVASTVNEVLLLKHIVATTSDKKLKKYLLSYFLEMLRTTLFRQTQFAEFEYETHAMVERGQPLTYESMNELYLGLNKKYYGDEVLGDDCVKYEWARIPHFYRAFYVYKYATGIISAVSIADKILSGDKNALVSYKKFLSAGGSTNPVDILKIAGVDLMTKAPFERAMAVFKETLEELKKA